MSDHGHSEIMIARQTVGAPLLVISLICAMAETAAAATPAVISSAESPVFFENSPNYATAGDADINPTFTLSNHNGFAWGRKVGRFIDGPQRIGQLAMFPNDIAPTFTLVELFPALSTGSDDAAPRVIESLSLTLNTSPDAALPEMTAASTSLTASTVDELIFNDTQDGLPDDMGLNAFGAAPVQSSFTDETIDVAIATPLTLPSDLSGQSSPVRLISSDMIMVSNAQELATALQSAQGGETILLAGGNYGALSIGNQGIRTDGFDVPVHIAALDPDDPAILTGLTIKKMHGLTFEGITFDHSFKGESNAMRATPFKIITSQDIRIENCVFDGDIASGTGDAATDGYGVGFGLTVTDSSEIALIGNEFHTFWKGMRLTQSTDLTIAQNEIHNFRSDGINLVEVGRVLIENNHIHDRVVSPISDDHGDMIQLWTNNTTSPSHDVTVRGNLLDIGKGDYAQSIFMTNTEVSHKGAGTEMYLRNFLIEDNVIINVQRNAIDLGAGDNMVVRNNTVILAPEQYGSTKGNQIPLIDISALSSNVEVSNNVTSKIVLPTDVPSDWKVTNNLLVQYDKPTAANYYADLFPEAQGDLGGHPEKLFLETDSFIGTHGLGASGLINGKLLEILKDIKAELPPTPAIGRPETPVIDEASEHAPGEILFDLGDTALTLDSENPYVKLETDTLQFEADENFGVAFDFTRTEVSGRYETLLWNHGRIGVRIHDEGLQYVLADAEGDIHRNTVSGLGLETGETHHLEVIVTADTNTLYLILDDAILAVDDSQDWDIHRDGHYQHGWSVGNKWGNRFTGQIDDLVMFTPLEETLDTYLMTL